MSIALGLAIYLIIWWTVLFAVLPIGLRTQAEEGEIVPGTPESAPARPRLARVFLMTTVASAVIFGLGWWAFASGLVDLRALTTSPGG